MAYIDTGAYVSGSRPVTRQSLRDALKHTPGIVQFDSTHVAGINAGRKFAADPRDLGARKLLVGGPDPGSPEWFITVEARCAHLTVDIPVDKEMT